MYTCTKQQKKDFINEIAPLAQMAYETLGKVKPSVCIGMACVESNYGWGQKGTRLMYNQHAVLGQKVGTGKTAKTYWNGKFFIASTAEEYVVGQHTIIKDAFRAYDSLAQCVLNYYELLNTNIYKKVKANVDYKTQMQQIKDAGYMTSSTEVGAVLQRINEFNLTKYDTVVKDETDKPKDNKKSVNEIAKEVIAGKWGNGVTRKTKLTLAGYNYKEVQAEVNRILKG